MEMKVLAKTLVDSALRERHSEAEAAAKRSNGRSIRQTRQYAGTLSRVLIACLKFSLLVAGLVFFWQVFNYAYVSDQFAVSQIAIQGNQYVESRRLESIIRQEFPPLLLRINLKRLQDRIEMEPWIQRAEVRRILPNKLFIQVVERAPKAVAMMDGAFHLVDGDGVLLGKYEPRLGKFDLPILKGLLPLDQRNYLEENKKRAALYFKIIERLDLSGKKYSKEISELDVSRLDDPVFVPMNDTVTVHLGDKDFLQRYLNFTTHWSEYQAVKEKHGSIESIDLRYENQVVFVPLKTP